MTSIIVFGLNVILLRYPYKFVVFFQVFNKHYILFYIKRGNQDVIQRELKDFLDNNRFTEKEIVKETGLTIVDASRFLLDGWHTKEEKRQAFFKWYLQKKLCSSGLFARQTKCLINTFVVLHYNICHHYNDYMYNYWDTLYADENTSQPYNAISAMTNCLFTLGLFTQICRCMCKTHNYSNTNPRRFHSHLILDSESFTCYKCGKIFAYESYLERHVKYVCPDKTGRTWKCSYCVKAFQYPCYLRRHMRSHTGKINNSRFSKTHVQQFCYH